MTGALPTSVSVAITFWVSDPAWHVAPELYVGQHSWLVTLSTQQGSSFGVSHPDAQAAVVLWGNAELSDPHPACLLLDVGLNCSRPMSAAPPGSYHSIQVPRQQAYPYIGRVFLATQRDIPGHPGGPQFRRRFFRVTARDFYATGPVGVSGKRAGIAHHGGHNLGGLVGLCARGGDPAPTSGSCSADQAKLPAAIAAAAGSAPEKWYEATCQAPTIELFTGAGQRFSDSTVAPTSVDNGIATPTLRSPRRHNVIFSSRAYSQGSRADCWPGGSPQASPSCLSAPPHQVPETPGNVRRRAVTAAT